MATVVRLRYSTMMSSTWQQQQHVPGTDLRQISNLPYKFPAFPASFPQNHSLSIIHNRASAPRFSRLEAASTGGDSGNSGTGDGKGKGGGDGNNGGWSGGDGSEFGGGGKEDAGIWGILLRGWRSRVAADPQFPFKVLMEQLVGVTACVLGDMACRPNFGLNELDFVFSTLVVGSIMNFTLMYLLAPTMGSSAASQTLPGIFSSCPTGYMFEPGTYSIPSRVGTFVFKGIVFASVGFAAGLVGTALSNGLIKLRKKMDPDFETPNKPPPTVLNALTWAVQMGISSNFRYQTLNGVEFLLEKSVPEAVFKSSVVVLRCLNNVLGGMSFVMLARLTGSQSVNAEAAGSAAEKQKLVDDGHADLRSSNQSSS
ncbi:protein RETICULATA-RELATED 3, chloroplastic-like [Melia azedarach]|uniref:Protein RETICULATA-RELATED 3, chloroplastic-like n=2 Tax=Melia azedarach TaxID=155640 RepID=A0ACC1WYE5_MELAZ|nr:protein RETICULATA-RELATED 3, chloroplastic-like [Melia azedarach]KAJ4704195.1 protein RETICULATA-RELATED 3, chloroplastic-like [Melia azedarach]